MSIILKTVGKREYAYSAYRLGKKVIHKYIGPVSKDDVASKIEKLRVERAIPERVRALFWDVDSNKINLRANARYIIERILETGDMEAFDWLQRIYPARTIIEVLETSRKISPKSKHFWSVWYGTH